MTSDGQEFAEIELATISRRVGDQVTLAQPIDKERNANNLANRIRQGSSKENLFLEGRIPFFVLLKREYNANNSRIRLSQSVTSLAYI